MPQRAFVPAPLLDAQPRVYRSFRGRQLRGILLGLAGAAVSSLMFGLKDPAGQVMAIVAALPGFAHGYYQPHGKPAEYWVRVWWRFYTHPQVLTAAPVSLHTRWVERVSWWWFAIRAAARVLLGFKKGAKRT